MNSLDLAVIGNCTISALVDRRAQIVWSCFPRFDGDPVFSALLDSPEGRSDAEQKGVFAIDMVGMVSCEQSYIENTAVLLSRMTDSFGNILEITDFAPRFKHYDRTFRPPMLVRRVQPVKGRPRIRVRLRPHYDWGGQSPNLTRGSNHLRFVGPAYSLRLTTDASVSYVQEERPFVVDRPMSFFFGEDEPLRSETDTTARELPRQHHRFLARLGALALDPLRLAGGGDPRRHHAQAVQLRGDRRHRGGADHLGAGGAAHEAQLGLPLLLAA